MGHIEDFSSQRTEFQQEFDSRVGREDLDGSFSLVEAKTRQLATLGEFEKLDLIFVEIRAAKQADFVLGDFRDS